jgi:hypothetical protein
MAIKSLEVIDTHYNREIEPSSDLRRILSGLNEKFQYEVEVRDQDPKAPFLWWNTFKNKDGELARAVINAGRLLYNSKSGSDIDAVCCLPASMSWFEGHLVKEDHDAMVVPASRTGFDGSVPIFVPSYTKKANGEKRLKGEPRENLPMYFGEQVLGAKTVLLYDDVLANGDSLEAAAAGLKRDFGVQRVKAVVAISKNCQGGWDKLQHSENVDEVCALIRVAGIRNGNSVITERWWE